VVSTDKAESQPLKKAAGGGIGMMEYRRSAGGGLISWNVGFGGMGSIFIGVVWISL